MSNVGIKPVLGSHSAFTDLSAQLGSHDIKGEGDRLKTSWHRRIQAITCDMYATALIVGAVAILSLFQPAKAICPDAYDIKPCTCDDEGLQCLKLNNSGLARVFKAPAARKAIRRVWIFQTNLTSLPRQAFDDYIIRDLYLDLNQITSVEPGAFGQATKTLQSLSLTRNFLSSFPFDDLGDMKKLKQFGLGHNQLTKLTAHAFPPSDSLESLDLSHNNISIIEAYAFADLHEVSLIDLSRNKLSKLDSNSLLIESSSRHLAVSCHFFFLIRPG